MGDPDGHTWDRVGFVRDLRHFWDIRKLERQLTPVLFLGLGSVNVRRGGTSLSRPKLRRALQEEILSLIQRADLGKQFTSRDVTNFISEAARSRRDFHSKMYSPKARPADSYDELDLMARLGALASEVHSQMRKYPSSVDKTLAFFEAGAEYEDSPCEDSPEGLILLKDNAKVRERASVLLKRLGGPGSPPLGAESFANITRFRFLKVYGPEFGADWLDEIVEYFRRSVNEIELVVSSAGVAKYVLPSPYQAGEMLWLMSRAPGLVSQLLPEIRRVLDLLLAAQTANGAWLEDWRPEGTHPPSRWQQDTAAATMCAIGMQKLGDERHAAAARRAAVWVARNQNGLGFWELYGACENPSILATVTALEVIRRAGLNGMDEGLRKGERWIIAQQDPVGLWFDNGNDHDFVSVAVCEYFRDARQFRPIPPGLLRTARGFLRRAQELTIQPGPDAARLAVIAAFHAVEMFVYAVGGEERLSLPIFEKSGDTVGLRPALALLRDKLRELGELKSGAELRYTTQIKHLATLRDQVVHKGADVSQDIAVLRVESAAKFIEHYSQVLLGLRIFD